MSDRRANDGPTHPTFVWIPRMPDAPSSVPRQSTLVPYLRTASSGRSLVLAGDLVVAATNSRSPQKTNSRSPPQSGRAFGPGGRPWHQAAPRLLPAAAAAHMMGRHYGRGSSRPGPTDPFGQLPVVVPSGQMRCCETVDG